ncbi:MAG: DUF3006 domain-containing protein [Bacillota bacterium]|nr:MAG: DUF3006 domain-containing protein [Bacillota bacterium]
MGRKGIIDRFEGDFAVIETSHGMINVKKHLLPENAREGDVINLEDFSIDETSTAFRRKKIEKLTEELFDD